VFNALTEGPNEATFPHAARWYKHIAEVKGLAAKYEPQSELLYFGHGEPSGDKTDTDTLTYGHAIVC